MYTILNKKVGKGVPYGGGTRKKLYHQQKSIGLVSFLAALTIISRGLVAQAFFFLDGDEISARGSQKISSDEGNLGFSLQGGGNPDLFGHSVAPLGDLNGDGIPDVAVGSFGDDGGFNTGEVYVLFLDADGKVSSSRKISDSSGGQDWMEDVDLEGNSLFGAKLGSAGDINNDGINELIVGNYGHGNDDKGAAWILFLDEDGSVTEWRKITEGQSNFNGELSSGGQFGSAVSTIGDVDNDGVPDLAIGAWHDSEKESYAGALWILFMNSDGTVKSHTKIPSVESDELAAESFFGTSVAPIRKSTGDNNTMIAVGQKDAVWILSLDQSGNVVSSNKIDPNDFYCFYSYGDGYLSDGFGWDVSEAGDVDYDGNPDLFVSRRPTDGSNGEVKVLLLSEDGNLLDCRHVIADGIGTLSIPANTLFGSSVALLGDVNGDGYPDLAVGAILDTDKAGAVWIINLTPPAKQLYACLSDDYVDPFCITLKESVDPNKADIHNFNQLELQNCAEQPSGSDLYKRQLWIFDGNTGAAQKFRTKVDPALETCVETYAPSEARLRINPCDKANLNTYNEFIFEKVGEDGSWDDVAHPTYKIKNAVNTDYCVTNVGHYPNFGEPIKLLPCEDGIDFKWTAATIPAADWVC